MGLEHSQHNPWDWETSSGGTLTGGISQWDTHSTVGLRHSVLQYTHSKTLAVGKSQWD